jgi:hypothetical protein
MIRTACLSVVCLIGSAVAAADDPQKPPTKPDEQPATDAPAQEAKKPDAKPAPAIGDVDLLKSLEKQLAPPDAGEHPLVKIGGRMRDVQGRLDKTDPGDETRGIQKEIVEDLDKLIEQIKKGGG